MKKLLLLVLLCQPCLAATSPGTISTVAVSAFVTLPRPTGPTQTVFVTGAAGTVLSAVTTAITMPATPVDQGRLTVTFDTAQVPSWNANTGQAFATGTPPSLLMQAGSSIEFFYDGSGTRGAAKSWYWTLLNSADGGAYSSSGVFQSGTLASAVQTLQGQVTALVGTSGDITVTPSAGTATFDVGANIAKLAAANVFTANQQITSAEPRILLFENDQAANAGLWDIDVSGGTVCFRTRSDVDGTGINVWCMARAGGVTAIGAVQGTGLVPTATTVTGTRVNLCATNQIGLVSGGVQALCTNSAGDTVFQGATVAGGAVPTIATVSGCTSLSAVGGDASTFTFTQTSATTGVCSFRVTFPTAYSGGYHCWGSEETQGTTLFQLSHTTTTAVLKTGATTANGDAYIVSCKAMQ